MHAAEHGRSDVSVSSVTLPAELGFRANNLLVFGLKISALPSASPPPPPCMLGMDACTYTRVRTDTRTHRHACARAHTHTLTQAREDPANIPSRSDRDIYMQSIHSIVSSARSRTHIRSLSSRLVQDISQEGAKERLDASVSCFELAGTRQGVCTCLARRSPLETRQCRGRQNNSRLILPRAPVWRHDQSA